MPLKSENTTKENQALILNSSGLLPRLLWVLLALFLKSWWLLLSKWLIFRSTLLSRNRLTLKE